ncbi:MAG: hypothetical protein RL141_889 [Candidatus Parcubacteria bacterium]|jgi:uncharacterized membrane protein required for colicin V production
MFLFELLVLILLLGFAANGFRMGVVVTLGRFIGALVGFWAAKRFAGVPVTVLGLFLPLSWAYVASFLVIFSLANHLVGFLFGAVDRVFGVLTKLPLIKQVSQVAGLVIGIFEGIVVIGGVSYLLRQLSFDGGITQAVVDLKIVQIIEKIFTTILGFLL